MYRSTPHSARAAAAAAVLSLSTIVACGDPIAPRSVPEVGTASMAKQGSTGAALLLADAFVLYSANESGTVITPMTLRADFAVTPSWAPDGKRVIFGGSGAMGGAGIYIMNVDGSAITRITRPPEYTYDRAPVAFGKDVVFERYSNGVPVLHRIRVDGSGESPLVSGAEPASAPGGDLLAYAAGGDIWEYNAATRTTRNLSQTMLATESAPAYSPSGKLIAFVRTTTGTTGLFVMRADGSAVTRLLSSDSDAFLAPKWSPDGKRIAYTFSVNGLYPTEIRVINADGTGDVSLIRREDSSLFTSAWAR